MRIIWKKCMCYLLITVVIALHVLLQQLRSWVTPPAHDVYPRVQSVTLPFRSVERVPEQSIHFNIPSLQQPSMYNITTSSLYASMSSTSSTYNSSIFMPSNSRYMLLNSDRSFNCSNINEIIIRHKLGQGVTKQVYLGMYKGYKVAVKMVTKSSLDVKSCLSQMSRDGYDLTVANKRKCYDLTSYKLVKELLLLQQLNHPNIMRLLGYCVRSEETESLSLDDHGVVLVYEYGLPFYISSVRRWPWYLRHKTAVELTHLLNYLQNSPIGSMLVADFKPEHFLMKDGHIKLIDLDDLTSEEPKCTTVQQQSDKAPCKYMLKCTANHCDGYNAKQNLRNFHTLFFDKLLFADMINNTDHRANLIWLKSKLDGDQLGAKSLLKYLFRMSNVKYYSGYSS